MKKSALTVVVAPACLLAACAWVQQHEHTGSSATARLTSVEPHQIAQIGFGASAGFAPCSGVGCPVRTEKTLSAPTRSFTPSSMPGAGSAVARETRSDRPVDSQADIRDRSLTLLFASGGAALTTTHRRQLREALPTLHTNSQIRIAGRTDDLGSTKLNQALALARGLAVRDYLLRLDPALPARITIDARGRCCYVAPNDAQASRSRNRRVEVSYVAKLEGPTP